MIVADTSVWIRYFRSPRSLEGREVDRLLEGRQVIMAGVIMAEILQGARNSQDFSALARRLGRMPYVEADRRTWLRAGELSMQLRSQGRLIPLTDLLIAALALEGDHQVYTLDDHFQRVPGLRLHEIGVGR